MQFHVIILFSNFLFVLCTAAPILEDSSLEHIEDLGEYGGYFEGDMVLTRAQYEALTTGRNGVRDVNRHWPHKTVVYHIEENAFDDDQVKMIMEALAEISNKSCIQFRKKSNKNEHAVIIQSSEHGCFSHVGYNNPDDTETIDEGAKQVLNLSSRCFRRLGTVIHEMLHTIGFYHMQSTYNRDDYVTIVWENIISGHEHNFEKHSKNTVNDYGVAYDYGSVMHYSGTAFSKNGNDTIIPKEQNVEIGQRVGMSKSDALKLNRMYCSSSSIEVDRRTTF